MDHVKRTDVTLAIEALRTASRKVKLTSVLEDAVEQLDSVVKLLVSYMCMYYYFNHATITIRIYRNYGLTPSRD